MKIKINVKEFTDYSSHRVLCSYVTSTPLSEALFLFFLFYIHLEFFLDVFLELNDLKHIQTLATEQVLSVLQLPEDIEWHFIGNLQSNKARALLAGVPNLDMVESVDDQKIANRLDRVVADLGRKPLKVLVQVNTSGEESKFGVDPSGCVELAKHVKLGCPNLVFSGLMTIGMLDYSSTPENFKALANCRKEVCKELGIPEEQCELSMGMSADFEQAIEMGSTNVRVGSTIFGAREYPKKN